VPRSVIHATRETLSPSCNGTGSSPVTDGREGHFWLEAEHRLNEERIRRELKTHDTL
jgi:hypothetical protein